MKTELNFPSLLPAALFLTALLLCSCGRAVAENAGGSQDGSRSEADREMSELIERLPDFSYAGYCYGEKPVPRPKYRQFTVTDFGAVPDDGLSDKAAIQRAIEAAESNGSGIVFFPKGRYLVNEPGEQNVPIRIKGSRIILRGEDGAVLFMKEHNLQTDPDKLWSTPCLFLIDSGIREKAAARVDGGFPRGSRIVRLRKMPSGIGPGDWITLSFRSNDPERVARELAPHRLEPKWTALVRTGVEYRNFYQVKAVYGNTVEFCSPLMCDLGSGDNWQLCLWSARPQTGVGVENLHFEGNYLKPFEHHATAVDDGGWSFLRMARNADSWIRDCVFENVSSAGAIVLCANVSFLRNRIIGNGGHSAMTVQASSNVLIARCTDEASQWHTWGVSKPSMNTVIWRCKAPATTCFESHASQPRNTLFDCLTAGFMMGRAGGAEASMPNHMQNLILWNYRQLNAPQKEFDFWPARPWHWRIHSVLIVGGFAGGTTFKSSPTVSVWKIGRTVQPESLYEAQLVRRLGSLPAWVEELKAGE